MARPVGIPSKFKGVRKYATPLDPRFVTLFWSKVEASQDPDACWIWRGSRDRKGYGGIAFSRKRRVATRLLVHILFGDALSSEIWVLHRCDNPPCMNPAHLFLGSAADNTADMLRKGRHRGDPTSLEQWKAATPGYVAGEKNPAAKLTADDVRAIRASTIDSPTLSKQYGVVKSTIAAIRQRRLWAHVD